MKPIRTAIIGTGFMGRAHLEAVRRTESVEAVAIAGRSVEAAQRIGAGFSIPTISTNYMLARIRKRGFLSERRFAEGLSVGEQAAAGPSGVSLPGIRGSQEEAAAN